MFSHVNPLTQDRYNVFDNIFRFHNQKENKTIGIALKGSMVY